MALWAPVSYLPVLPHMLPFQGALPWWPYLLNWQHPSLQPCPSAPSLPSWHFSVAPLTSTSLIFSFSVYCPSPPTRHQAPWGWVMSVLFIALSPPSPALEQCLAQCRHSRISEEHSTAVEGRSLGTRLVWVPVLTGNLCVILRKLLNLSGLKRGGWQYCLRHRVVVRITWINIFKVLRTVPGTK